MNPVDEAKQDLNTHGWNKGGPYGPNGEKCLVMVLPSTEPLLWDAVASVVREQYPDRIKADSYRGFQMAQFNDHPDTTRADVDVVLEKASIVYEEQV
jgi:hypothetical protein